MSVLASSFSARSTNPDVAVRPQADGRPDDAIPGGVDRREVERGPRSRLALVEGRHGTASAEAESEKRHATGLDRAAPVHEVPCRRILSRSASALALLMKTAWQPENRRHQNARDDRRPQRRAIQAPLDRGRSKRLSGS